MPTYGINEEISENLSTPMALGNNSIRVLAAFGNSFVTAPAALNFFKPIGISSTEPVAFRKVAYLVGVFKESNQFFHIPRTMKKNLQVVVQKELT